MIFYQLWQNLFGEEFEAKIADISDGSRLECSKDLRHVDDHLRYRRTFNRIASRHQASVVEIVTLQQGVDLGILDLRQNYVLSKVFAPFAYTPRPNAREVNSV